MRHHFGDFLDRDGGYWSMTPNAERYRQGIDEAPAGSEDVVVATIGKETEDWRRVFSFPNLEELTLHEPTTDQLSSVGELGGLKRLRLTHVRPKTIDALSGLGELEELVLEYVSGFNDLSPLRGLPKLRAIHIENLRRVSDFSGLSGLKELRLLSVYGTLDWKQPIDDFEFLRGLPALEVLSLWQMKCRAPYPALLPALTLRRLKEISVHGSYLPVEECALLEEGLDGIEGADWGPYHTMAYSYIELPGSDPRSEMSDDDLRRSHPEVTIDFEGKRTIANPEDHWFVFTGTGSGRVKCGSPKAEARCREFAEKYRALRQRARDVISSGA